MIRSWARAHNVVLVVALTITGCVALVAVADTTFTAPRQPIPLQWPLGAIVISGTMLVFDSGFGAVPQGMVRGVEDRFPTVAVTVALTAMVFMSAAVAKVDQRLLNWLLVVATVGVVIAAARGTGAFIVALLVGLVGVGLEFTTPLGLITRHFDQAAPMGWLLMALALASAAYVLQPLLKQRL